MNGFAILLTKELRESLRTRRLLVVGALFAVIGMLSPLTARYLPEILEAMLGSEAGFIPLPDPTAAMAAGELLDNLGQLGGLAAIALAMGLVAGELDRGTAAFVLTQPATRPAFLTAKLVALGAVLLGATLVAALVGWGYTSVLFEPQPIPGWVALALLAWLSLLTWGALTFLASTVTGSAAAAAGIGFVALVGISILSVIPALARFLPSGLVTPALLLATGNTSELDVAELLTAILGTGVLIGGSLLVAIASFRRREL